MRTLAAALFALAVGCTVLAGNGLVLVPHTHALGTPPDHRHGLALYRFPIALLGAPPDARPAATDGPGRASFQMTAPFGETVLGASLAIAVFLVLVALTPAARPERHVAAVLVPLAQWTPIARPLPPRAGGFPF